MQTLSEKKKGAAEYLLYQHFFKRITLLYIFLPDGGDDIPNAIC